MDFPDDNKLQIQYVHVKMGFEKVHWKITQMIRSGAYIRVMISPIASPESVFFK